MDDNDNHKDLKKYPGIYNQWIMGDHVARCVSQIIKTLKLKWRQRATKNAEPAHHRDWTRYLLLAAAIILMISLLEFLLK